MKFLTDAMFGRLTRLLRIFGYDTIYAEDIEHSAPDELLLEYAINHDRIIITQDYPFFKKAGPERSFYLEGKGVYNYLLQLEKIFDLEYDFKIRIARCSVCNSSLQLITDENLIKNVVKPDTLKYYNEFYQCINSDCKKVYWKGSHIEDIINKIHRNYLIES